MAIGHPIRYQPGDVLARDAVVTDLSGKESDELLERLKALGYVD
jgi:hypothetical protein